MNIFRNACIWAFVTGSGLLASTPVHAAYSDVTEMSKGWADMFKSTGQMIMIGMFLVGLVSVGYGLYSLAFPGSRMENNKGKSFACIGIGIILMGGSGAINMFSGSITGGKATGLGSLGIFN
jgi:hypothetical protein